MPVERRRKRPRVLLELGGQDRLRGKSRGHERLVDSVSRERVDEARRVADEEHPSPARWGAASPHREAMAADVAKAVGVDSMYTYESIEVCAKPRALGHPAAHADVRVVALREHPPVAATDA